MKLPPKRTRLPGGPWIKVKLASRHEVNVAAGKDVDGFWDYDNRAIWLDKNLAASRMWKVYAHELWFHAAIDLYDEMGETYKPWEE